MDEFQDGYDVEVVDKACDDFFCMICTKLMRNAIEMKCGHSLCEGCLERLLQSLKERRVNSLCPQCRSLILRKEARSAMTVRRSILSLKVKCKKLPQGCTWQDQLDNLQVHLERHCSFTEIECQFLECGIKVLRRDMQSHIKLCEYRLIQCQYCNTQIAFKYKQLHIAECLMFPITCALNCGFVYPRHEKLIHLDACPMQEIDCRYKSIGCHSKIIRNLQSDHLKNSSEKHMFLLFDDSKNCKVKLNETVEKLKKSEEKLDRVAAKFDTTAIEERLYTTEVKLIATEERLNSTESKLKDAEMHLIASNETLDITKYKLYETSKTLNLTEASLDAVKVELNSTKTELNTIKKEVKSTKTQSNDTKKQFEEKQVELNVIKAKLADIEESVIICEGTRTQWKFDYDLRKYENKPNTIVWKVDSPEDTTYGRVRILEKKLCIELSSKDTKVLLLNQIEQSKELQLYQERNKKLEKTNPGKKKSYLNEENPFNTGRLFHSMKYAEEQKHEFSSSKYRTYESKPALCYDRGDTEKERKSSFSMDGGKYLAVDEAEPNHYMHCYSDDKERSLVYKDDDLYGDIKFGTTEDANYHPKAEDLTTKYYSQESYDRLQQLGYMADGCFYIVLCKK